MPYTSVEKAFCVLEYARTHSIKVVQQIFVQRFERSGFGKVQTKSKSGHGIKSSRRLLVQVKESGRKSMSEKK